MLTGEVRNKVDKIWTDIWAGGITNPLTVIEQLTYLMFIRSLDEKELENENFEALTGQEMPKIFPQDEDGQAMRWSKFNTKTEAGGTDKVWFYDMKADGFSLDDKRSPIEGNDIPDILARFHNLSGEIDRKPTEQSFLVDRSAIEDNDYDLSINRYKKIVYEKVEYDSSTEIMARLDELNLDISSKMEGLRGLIG